VHDPQCRHSCVVIFPFYQPSSPETVRPQRDGKGTNSTPSC
jgi:hypothetical protein